MNERKVNTIIIIACIALVSLIAVQMYWVNNAINISKQRFDQSVNEALNKVVAKVEKETTAARITKRFKLRTQGVRTHSRDSLASKNRFGIDDKQVNVKIFEQFSSDSNGVVTKKEIEKSYSGDSAASGINITSEMQLPEYIHHFKTKELRNQFFENKSNMVNDIFDELVSINIYNDYNPRIDTILLDSILRNELLEKGITADFIFGITELKYPLADSLELSEKKKLLYDSKYKVNLSPDNVFIKPQYLSVHFPNQQKYLLQSLLFILSISLIVVIIIIYSFYYTIATILKQKKLSEIKNDFISNMTHEFKTPISTISLAAEMLNDKSINNSPEQREKFIQMIGNENKRLSILVENILQTAILDKGELKLKTQDIDIHNLIEQTINNIKLQVENKEGDIQTDLKATNSIVNADRVHLTNVIFNLIDNALKYTKEKPDILISTRNTTSGILISVKDNGIGISPENQKMVFDTMFRVHTGNIHDVKGFGLGLSYVKTVVEKHNGTISVESLLSEGSTFTIFLPQKQNTN